MPYIDDMNNIWQMVKENFRPQMENSTFDLWFGDMKVIEFDDKENILTLATTSEFKLNIIRNKFLPQIQSYFCKLLGFDITVVVVFNGAPENKEIIRNNIVDSVTQKTSLSEYNFEYTFDNFIVGDSNKFAHAACKAVADKPAESYNPLFIYGPSGLGKTHLLKAVINEIQQKKPNTKIVYVKGEDFTNEMIECLAKQEMKEFRNKYRNCDMLLIDDIQFIAGKTSTQEEFFHTFNTLFEDHKQIILTSDKPPKDISPLEERLMTRFEWGLIADIQPPNLELRIAIIKKKAEQVNVQVPDDVLAYLADNLRSNIRQIEGSIKKLGALSFLTGSPIDMNMAQNCIRELLSGQEPVETTISKIFKVLENHFGINRELLTGSLQKKEISSVRHIAMYMIRNITDMSLPNIGKIFGRDHSTVISSIKNVEKKISSDSNFEVSIGNMEKEVKTI